MPRRHLPQSKPPACPPLIHHQQQSCVLPVDVHRQTRNRLASWSTLRKSTRLQVRRTRVVHPWPCWLLACYLGVHWHNHQILWSLGMAPCIVSFCLTKPFFDEFPNLITSTIPGRRCSMDGRWFMRIPISPDVAEMFTWTTSSEVKMG